MSERMKARKSLAETVRSSQFRSWLDEANASADEGRERAQEALRRLNSPWLLLLLVPATLISHALALNVPDDVIRLVVAALAGRRWGVTALPPTLLLCVPELVEVPQLAGFGNIAMIPMLLIAARLGYDPGLLAALQRRTRLAGGDIALLLAAMLFSWWRITAFQPDFSLFAGSTTLLALLFLLLGATSVSARWPLLLAVGFAMHMLLVPLGRAPGNLYVNWSIGLWLHDAATCLVLFALARLLRAPPVEWTPWILFRFVAINILWVLALICGISEIDVHYPAAGLNTIDGSLVPGYAESLGPPTLVVALALLGWSAAPTKARNNRLSAQSMLLLIGLLIGAATILLLYGGARGNISGLFARPSSEAPLFSSYISGRGQAIENAVVLSLLCVGAIWIVERWQPRSATANTAGSFMTILLGRLWTIALAVQAGLLLTVALVLAVSAWRVSDHASEVPTNNADSMNATSAGGESTPTNPTTVANPPATSVSMPNTGGAVHVAEPVPTSSQAAPKSRLPRPRIRRTPTPTPTSTTRVPVSSDVYDKRPDVRQTAPNAASPLRALPTESSTPVPNAERQTGPSKQ